MEHPFDVERVHAGYDAYNEGQYDALLDLMTDDVEVRRSEAGPDSGDPIKGLTAFRAFLEPDALDQRMEIKEIRWIGERVLVDLVVHARGRGTAIELTQRGYHVWTVRDGRLSALEIFFDEERAERAARAE
jgi:ketosteroid isomerase-like protein